MMSFSRIWRPRYCVWVSDSKGFSEQSVLWFEGKKISAKYLDIGTRRRDDLEIVSTLFELLVAKFIRFHKR